MIKMSVLPKLTYRLNTMPVQILAGLNWRNFQAYFKTHMEIKKYRITKTTLKKNRFGVVTLSALKVYYDATIIQTVGLA